MNKPTIYQNKSGGYAPRFWDFINTKWVYFGTFKDLNDAEDILSEYQYNFYKDRTYLLPKGISLSHAKKKFIYAVAWEGKTIINKSFKLLEDALNFKEKFINRLMF